ncbi:MAG: hypothetical protein DHS20C01_08430 [marine bacterium B5-7]|nr:MAG: hypothetical protein DHS20C01_08430 [marine bacterium B5-7]
MAYELNAKKKDLGGFSVRRILPHADKPAVGPFIFFDHMGPVEFSAGEGINVRPHPHIGLATVTYLLEGSILHRDSIGNIQEIFPGDVNWMTAGRGIVHSERETLEVRSRVHRADGFQVWLALPQGYAQVEPAFFHFNRNALPHIMHDGVMMRLIAGSAYGRVSPVRTFSPMFYLDIIAEKDRTIDRPEPDMEAAAYVQQGEIEISGVRYSAGAFVILEAGDAHIKMIHAGRMMLLGGEPFATPPHIEWNFAAFDYRLIEEAKKRWRDGGFGVIPGDQLEHIPLPGETG